MKMGNEDRKKLVLAGTLGVVALATILYEFSGTGDASTPAATPAPAARTAATPNPVAHVSRSALDPTLHPDGMLAAEAIVYTGSGRNIFSGAAEAPKEIKIEQPIATARTTTPPPPAYAGPPPLPAIELRFFGTAQRQGGQKQAFFLHGDDVFLASEGDVVSRRYKIGPISSTAVQVTDLTNNNTQTLPLQQQ